MTRKQNISRTLNRACAMRRYAATALFTGIALMLAGCPEDDETADNEAGAAATHLTCGDLASAFEIDNLTNGVSDWDEAGHPMCSFDVHNAEGAGVQVFGGGEADYADMLEGSKSEMDMDVVETDTVGARSFEFSGVVGGWVTTSEIGFLDSTERFAVLVFINDSIEGETLEMVREIAEAVNANLARY